MAKERIRLNNLHQNLSPFLEATKKYMDTATFAPDLKKWKQKDIQKLLDADKKEEWLGINCYKEYIFLTIQYL